MTGQYKSHRLFREQKGFTILEALVSLVILGLAFSYILPGFSQLLDTQTYLTKQTAASILGRGKLAEIRTGAERAQEGTFPEPWSDLHWRYHEERPAEGLCRQIVVVRWEGFLGDKQIIISSLQVE